jgi:hypothetical protein
MLQFLMIVGKMVGRTLFRELLGDDVAGIDDLGDNTDGAANADALTDPNTGGQRGR